MRYLIETDEGEQAWTVDLDKALKAAARLAEDLKCEVMVYKLVEVAIYMPPTTPPPPPVPPT